MHRRRARHRKADSRISPLLDAREPWRQKRQGREHHPEPEDKPDARWDAVLRHVLDDLFRTRQLPEPAAQHGQ